VEAGAAGKLEIQLSYAIGDPEPFSTHVETVGTERVGCEQIESAVQDIFDFRPAAIIDALHLTRPEFARTTAYGHFGRPEFSWERLDRVEDIKSALGL
jgi:S-adenosylmethionine synthetase